MKLRAHQTAMVKRSQEIVAGTITDTVTLAHVVPGGGKTIMAWKAAEVMLEADWIDRVVYVAPRTSLRKQVVDEFKKMRPLATAGVEALRELRDNKPPFVRDAAVGQFGYATTYQAVASMPELHEMAVRQHRTLLIIDEAHHLSDEEHRAWRIAMHPLQLAATHTLLMTGTLGRSDGTHIPFAPTVVKGGEVYHAPHILFGLRDALVNRAILAATFYYQDSEEGQLINHKTGNTESMPKVSAAGPADESRVKKALLSDERFVEQMIRRCLDDWLQYRSETGHLSTCIVVCASQKMAQAMKKSIAKNYPDRQVSLAVSEDPASNKNLERYRKKEYGDILVTVNMASEGLDAPHCSHMCIASLINWRGWVEQCIGRSTREDRTAPIGYMAQSAFIYILANPSMKKVVEAIKTEQESALRERGTRERGDGPEPCEVTAIDPLMADGGMETWESEYDDTERRHVTEMAERVGLPSYDPAKLLLFKEMIGREAQRREPAPVNRGGGEEELRQTIERLARTRDSQYMEGRWGTTNKLLFRKFQQARDRMGVAELREVVKHLTHLKEVEGW